MALPVILARLGALTRASSFRAGIQSALSRGLNIEVLTDPKNIADVANKERKRIMRKKRMALLRTAIHGTNIILDRTEKGYGYNGAFKSYSPGYSLKRAAEGRTLTPNLFYTGRMLGSMTQKVISNDEARIFFTNADSSIKAAENERTRPFFGFNEGEKNQLRRVFFKEIMR